MVRRSALANGVLLALLLIAAGITYASYPRLAAGSLVLAIFHVSRILLRRIRRRGLVDSI